MELEPAPAVAFEGQSTTQTVSELLSFVVAFRTTDRVGNHELEVSSGTGPDPLDLPAVGHVAPEKSGKEGTELISSIGDLSDL